MLSVVMDWHASELDAGWCMHWKIVGEREAKKFLEKQKGKM